jgi:hypothetical protein
VAGEHAATLGGHLAGKPFTEGRLADARFPDDEGECTRSAGGRIEGFAQEL